MKITTYRIECLAVKPGDLVDGEILTNILFIEPDEEVSKLYIWYKDVDLETEVK